jgi:hypothetical protein
MVFLFQRPMCLWGRYSESGLWGQSTVTDGIAGVRSLDIYLAGCRGCIRHGHGPASAEASLKQWLCNARVEVTGFGAEC